MLHPTCRINTEMGNEKLDLSEMGVAVEGSRHICLANMLLCMCRLERSCNHGDSEPYCILILALSTDVFVIPILEHMSKI
jgi:hypothetical protein